MASKSKIAARLIMGCCALGEEDFAVAALGIASVIAPAWTRAALWVDPSRGAEEQETLPNKSNLQLRSPGQGNEKAEFCRSVE